MLNSVITIRFELGTYVMYVCMEGSFLYGISVILVCVTITALLITGFFHLK